MHHSLPDAVGRIIRVGCLVLLSSWPATAAEPPAAVQYEFVEDWSIAAQGPVYLREKRVTATFRLEVVELSKATEAGRTLQVRFVDVAVDADIPAQKRSGSLNSQRLPEELLNEHHELVRPLSLWQRTFELTYTPEQALQKVAGGDAAIRRLDELYDEHLRGSEQDLYTRPFERERLSADALRRAWAPLFLIPAEAFRETTAPRQFATEAEFIACIPSESWRTIVKLPVTETVTATPQPDGTMTVTGSTVLAQIDTVETTIGDAGWKYTPQSAEREVTLRVRPDGRVESLNSSAKAVLQTTLSLGNDVPIKMTIEQSVKLSRR